MKTYAVGDYVRRVRDISSHDVTLFRQLVGDTNPILSDAAAARRAGFSGPIAHGMVAGSLFSEILGNDLPGPGSVYLEQTFRFLSQVYVPSQIELFVEVTAVRHDQKIVTVRTYCLDSTGKLCMDGEGKLLRRNL